MKRVIVVDDSAVIRAMLRQILLTIKDCSVSLLQNGREALQHITDNGEPDLILLDVNMPIMNGLECLDELRARGVAGRVPIVLVTTEGKEADVARGMAAGAREYIKKPFEPMALRAALVRLLA